MPVFYNMKPMEKREVLVCVLQYLHHLDDVTLIKTWQQSAAQTKLFFKLLEECQDLFEVILHFGYQGCIPKLREFSDLP
jgi:hypothetical protein